jgi:hypothetical protein
MESKHAHAFSISFRAQENKNRPLQIGSCTYLSVLKFSTIDLTKLYVYSFGFSEKRWFVHSLRAGISSKLLQ